MNELGISRMDSEVLKRSEMSLWITSMGKLMLGILFMIVFFTIYIHFLLLLLPFRITRIKASGLFANFCGHVMVKMSGSRLLIKGKEHLDRKRPAIYISNHSSVLDLFIAMSRIPIGTSGVSKKEIVRIPFFGQVYALSGHLLIDRKNSKSAIAAMRKMGETVIRHKLSVFIWPEGTRSRDGRLSTFKKGFAHMAIQTGLPVVPFVIKHANRSWKPGSQIIRGLPVEVEVLDAIDTSSWDVENIDRHIEDLRCIFAKHLPQEQRPKAA